MKIILKKHVRKLGKVGDIVDVKTGYGKNYLLPNGAAIRASKENIASFEQKRKELDLKNLDQKQNAEAASAKITGENIIFISQSAADGRLFGSISAKMLAAEISKITEFELNYSNILIVSPIKLTGIHNVEVSFHPDVHRFLNVVVARSQSEAQDMIVAASKVKVLEKSDAQQAVEFAESGMDSFNEKFIDPEDEDL